MNKKFLISSLVFVFAISAAVVFYMTPKAEAAKLATCSEKWAKIMDGSSTGPTTEYGMGGLNAYKLSFSKNLYKKDLENMVIEGCSFKVLETLTGDSGLYEQKSFNCVIANLNHNSLSSWEFQCHPNNIVVGPTETNNVVGPIQLFFDSNGVYYYGNAEKSVLDPVSKIGIKLFAQK